MDIQGISDVLNLDGIVSICCCSITQLNFHIISPAPDCPIVCHAESCAWVGRDLNKVCDTSRNWNRIVRSVISTTINSSYVSYFCLLVYQIDPLNILQTCFFQNCNEEICPLKVSPPSWPPPTPLLTSFPLDKRWFSSVVVDRLRLEFFLKKIIFNINIRCLMIIWLQKLYLTYLRFCKTVTK